MVDHPAKRTGFDIDCVKDAVSGKITRQGEEVKQKGQEDDRDAPFYLRKFGGHLSANCTASYLIQVLLMSRRQLTCNLVSTKSVNNNPKLLSKNGDQSFFGDNSAQLSGHH